MKSIATTLHWLCSINMQVGIYDPWHQWSWPWPWTQTGCYNAYISIMLYKTCITSPLLYNINKLISYITKCWYHKSQPEKHDLDLDLDLAYECPKAYIRLLQWWPWPWTQTGCYNAYISIMLYKTCITSPLLYNINKLISYITKCWYHKSQPEKHDLDLDLAYECPKAYIRLLQLLDIKLKEKTLR